MSINEFETTIKKKGISLQAIINVNYDDNRLLPLTEDCPVCLLPISNKKILGYQLDILKQSGITEIFIVTPSEYYLQLSEFLISYGDEETLIELIQVPELFGSTDAIRAVHDRIRGDFIVFNSDTISQINLAELVFKHRLQCSDVTMLLAVAPLEESEKKGVPPTLKIHGEDKEFIGTLDDGRVVFKKPALEIEVENVEIKKTLLTRYTGGGVGGGMDLRCDLIDIEIYVMSHWVIEFLMANKKLTSIRTDLIPYLVSRQGQSNSYLLENIAGLTHRKRPLQAIDAWNVHMRSISSSSSHFLLPFDVHTSTPLELSQCTDNSHVNSDLLRCYSVIVDRDTVTGHKGPLCQRITTLQTYLNINRDLPLIPYPQQVSYPLSCFQLNHQSNYVKKEQSIIGIDFIMGEKVTIKQCTIGNNCKIGAKTKLNNCILLNNVEIGESCTIQNCILGSNTIIGNNCNLNECYSGKNVNVIENSRLKSEVLTSNEGNGDDENDDDDNYDNYDDIDDDDSEDNNK